MRSMRSRVTLSRAMVPPGSDEDWNAGLSAVVAEEGRLPGQCFEALRRTETCIARRGSPRSTGRSERLAVPQAGLRAALGAEPTSPDSTVCSNAALTPQKDQT